MREMVSLRALAPSFPRVTIAAAIGAALHIGQGNKEIIDQKAIDFARAVFNQMEIEGEIISCEGPKDNAPAFFIREKVGQGGLKLEFVIDPVDGTTAVSKGQKDAISALACAPTGKLKVLPDDGYYFKIATDFQSKNKLSLDMSIEDIVRKIAATKGKRLENFTVIMLDRKRHYEILRQLRELGVRIILIPDGDIAAAVVACLPNSGVDLLLGAGAGPEATIAASAVKCLRGTMLVKVWHDHTEDPNREERLAIEGVESTKTYTEEELAKGDQLVFAASGVTKGELLDGVTFIPNGAVVESLCTRLPSGTIEKAMTTVHFVGHPVYKGFGIDIH
jgi:fructose-1,6-bisphosphatase II